MTEYDMHDSKLILITLDFSSSIHKSNHDPFSILISTKRGDKWEGGEVNYID